MGLTGKWQVVGIYEFSNEKSEWYYTSSYKSGEVVWEFTDDLTLTTFFNGMMDYTVNYRLGEKKLTIDYSSLDVFKVTRERYVEHYRVEFNCPNTILLYDLENVNMEPDDYWLMVKLRRIFV